MRLSVSFKTSSKMTNLRHNNRELTEKEFSEPAHRHIMQDKSRYNILIIQENLDEVYDREFGEALAKYNTKQKRKDRIIKNYKNHVYHSKTLDLQREFIVSLGSKADWDNLSFEYKQLAGEKLTEYIFEFESRHPQLKIFNAVVHLDEKGAPHAHFNIVPVATGYKNGLEKQPSFSKALYQEGINLKGKIQYKVFRDNEIKFLTEKLHELGFERKIVGTNNIKDMYEYKKIMHEINLMEKEKNEILESTQKIVHDSDNQVNRLKIRIRQLERVHEETKKQVEHLREELASVKQNIDQEKNQYSKLQEEKGKLKDKVEEYHSFMNQHKEEFSDYEAIVQKKQEYVDFLEDSIKRLEKDNETLQERYLEVAEKIFEKLKGHDVYQSELDNIKVKKGVVRKDYVELSKEQYNNFKWSYNQILTELNKTRRQLRIVHEKLLIKTHRNSVEDQIKEIQIKNELERLKNLKEDYQILKNENSVLKQQNQKMLSKLREVLPMKLFDKFVSELKAIQPKISNIIHRTLDKGRSR